MMPDIHKFSHKMKKIHTKNRTKFTPDRSYKHYTLEQHLIFYYFYINPKVLVLVYHACLNFFSLKNQRGGEYTINRTQKKINYKRFKDVIILKCHLFLCSPRSHLLSMRKRNFLVTSTLTLSSELMESLIIKSQPSKI